MMPENKAKCNHCAFLVVTVSVEIMCINPHADPAEPRTCEWWVSDFKPLTEEIVK